MTNPGKYIVIDGLPGDSKTALVQRLVAELQAQQIPVKLLMGWDGYEDLTVQTLQRMASDSRYPKTASTAVLLQHAAFSESLETIRASVAAGIVCIVDQGSMQTLVTQYYGQSNQLDYTQLDELVRFAYGELQPDLLLLLDSDSSDQSVHGDLALHDRLRAGFLWEAKQRSIAVVHGSRDNEQVFDEVWKEVAAIVADRPRATEPSSSQSIGEVLATRQVVKTPETPPPVTAPVQSAATSVATDMTALDRLLLAQSGASFETGHVWYEERDANGHYRFAVPEVLKGKVRSQYIRTMNQLFEAYSRLLDQTTAHLASSAKLPVSEARVQARKLVQAILPVSSTRPTTGDDLHSKALSPTNEALQKIADELLPPYYTGDRQSLSLTSYNPHNELDIVPAMLYPYGDLPRNELTSLSAQLPYQRKIDVLQAYFAGNSNSGALDQVHYSFEVVSSFASLLRLVHSHGWRGVSWQSLSARLGYDTPKVIEEAGLSDTFDSCFDLCLELNSAIQAAHGSEVAQLATLVGHKHRWTVTLSAPETYAFLHQSQAGVSVEIELLAKDMTEVIREVHPLLAAYAGFKQSN